MDAYQGLLKKAGSVELMIESLKVTLQLCDTAHDHLQAALLQEALVIGSITPLAVGRSKLPAHLAEPVQSHCKKASSWQWHRQTKSFLQCV